MEEVNCFGGHSAAGHVQMHMMGAVLRHGSTEQKQAYMAGIADGSIRQPTQTDSNSLAWARPRVPDSHSSRVPVL